MSKATIDDPNLDKCKDLHPPPLLKRFGTPQKRFSNGFFLDNGPLVALYYAASYLWQDERQQRHWGVGSSILKSEAVRQMRSVRTQVQHCGASNRDRRSS